MLESVYEEILFYELRQQNSVVERQKAIPVVWKEKKMEIGSREKSYSRIKIDRKNCSGASKTIAPVHPKQLLTYLRITNLRLGLLINFNEKLIKDGITRVVNNL